ncbi:hypothetical protein [Hyalangium versicolor]|uniref:hypothetical protein n=1 Tax=Hyalangium versicolor TaxID=2861190 RepID=UPI001CCB49C4|nr:hypothetical protein [Hyalangium versicolor]
MSSDVTIVVVGARGSSGPDSTALHASHRVDELQVELGRRLGQQVEVLHGTLDEAPPQGVLILFCPSLEETLADVPRELRARVIWMTAGRTEVREALARHGLLGAVERSRYFLWARARAQDRASGLYARADMAGELSGASLADAGVPGYVLLSDLRYRDLASLMGAYVAVANRRAPAPPDRPVEPPPVQEFPLGQVLDVGGEHGAYGIVRLIGGIRERGLYEARRVGAEEQEAYVSLGLRQTAALELKRAELELPKEGFAQLLGLVRFDHEGTEYAAMLEARPAGVPLPELLPGAISVKRAARLLLPMLGWVAAAHRQGRVLVGLRPELLFAALTGSSPDDPEYLPGWGTLRPRLTGVVPRYERFMETAERPCHGFGPPFETLYQAPEILALRPPEPAADVFSLAAILAWTTLGAYPFPGNTVADRMAAMMTGTWSRTSAPSALASLLSAGLSPAPTARPSLSAMEAQLAKLAA